jgi:glycine amidinotransferase
MGLYRFAAGWKYPKWMKKLAQKDLDGFIALLEGEGVKVRRPEIMDFSKKYRAPNWSSRGFTIACPRDAYMVVGDEIIESPMCWRSRYFEQNAYRPLFKEYFQAGAKWVSAPRPGALRRALPVRLQAARRRAARSSTRSTNSSRSSTRPTSSAAGRDLFVTVSNVTNRFGIEWLRRHLGDAYRIHEIPSPARSRCISTRPSCRSRPARCS